MGLGKITRGFGKVGMALEALGYVVAGAKALVRAVKGAPDARRDDVQSRQVQGTDTDLGQDQQ